MTSIYPPLALWWFRLLALAGGAWAAQVGSAAADVVTSVAIGAWRRDRGRSAWPAWLYALHPLPALESASGAHLEPVAIALCVGALWAWNRRRDHAAVALLVAGAGVKLLPLLLVPAIARGRTWITAMLALLALAALAWPVWDAGPALLTSARTYAAHWSFNGLLYPVVAPALGAAARPLLVATGAAIVVAAWRYSSGPVGVWTAVGSAFVLLSPTVHPWYVLWALAPSLLAGHWGWAAASVAFLPSYLVLRALDDTGAWVVPPWLPWVTWVPALGALAAEWGFRARPPDAP